MAGRLTWWAQVVRRASVILEYEERMLSLRPLGGSVTTFRLRCRMPMGKRSVGSVVSHNRKSCMLTTRSTILLRDTHHRFV